MPSTKLKGAHVSFALSLPSSMLALVDAEVASSRERTGHSTSRADIVREAVLTHLGKSALATHSKEVGTVRARHPVRT